MPSNTVARSSDTAGANDSRPAATKASQPNQRLHVRPDLTPRSCQLHAPRQGDTLPRPTIPCTSEPARDPTKPIPIHRATTHTPKAPTACGCPRHTRGSPALFQVWHVA